MNFRFLAASMLMTLLILPTALMAVPERAHAQGVPTGDLTTEIQSAISAIQDTLDTVYNFTSSVAVYAQWVNTYILQPLAFVLSGQLMKALTASVIKFAIGKANGTGIPQFTVDIQRSLRSISDFQAQAYFRQVSLTNSPFASSIAQALKINYAQDTSLAGFWRQNQNTLGQGISTYQPGYLSGNWAQGGTAAWFQLTTQTQNNPYILYQSVQTQLGNQTSSGVANSAQARVQQLAWGQGFMSWCSTTDSATAKQGDASTLYQSCIQQCNDAPGGYTSSCADSCGTNYIQGGGIINGGVNPGDPCTNTDGTAGTIQTPGSTIKATLDKVLGGQQDKLVQMGNISGQVNSILGNIGTILNTVNLAANILGGDSNKGLLNASAPGGAIAVSNSAGTPPAGFDQDGYFGATNDQIKASQSTSDVTAAKNANTQDAIAKAAADGLNAAQQSIAANGGTTSTTQSNDAKTRIDSYATSWGAIGLSANTTASALQTMMSVCRAYLNGNSTYENAAQNALSFEVSPVLTQAADAQGVVAAATAQYNLVQSEPTTSSTYSADLQKLNTMPPTASDVASAKYNATAYGGATANPAGSLTVSGGSIVDQMNLIRNNAANIQAAACTAINTGGA